MISKYAVYANVTKVTCHDGKKRYLILCPEEEATHCYECPFCERINSRYKLRPSRTVDCHLVNIAHDHVLCDTFDEVREIIEEAYGTCFIG